MKDERTTGEREGHRYIYTRAKEKTDIFADDKRSQGEAPTAANSQAAEARACTEEGDEEVQWTPAGRAASPGRNVVQLALGGRWW